LIFQTNQGKVFKLIMPNLKAAKKAIRSDSKKYVQNLRAKRTMKELEKKVRSLSSTPQAAEHLPAAYKAIDKAAKTGVIKKNTASRKKSRLTKAVTKQKDQ
jgi:small subunit ribosomal protein S20